MPRRPDTAENVVVAPSAGEFTFVTGCIPDGAGRCVVEFLPAGDEIGISLRIKPQTTEKTFPLTIDVTSATPDPTRTPVRRHRLRRRATFTG